MNYRNRYLESKIQRYSRQFPALLLTGARQVGKSTLLDHLFGEKMAKVVFDPVVDIGNARSDPEFFLAQHQAPIILAEIQYAPELLAVIKRKIDLNKKPGQYFMTGSQNLSLMRHVSESLAGRVVILDLHAMGLAEKAGLAESSIENHWLQIVLSSGTDKPELARFERIPQSGNLFTQLWRGGYPGVLDFTADLLPDFFRSYFQTYVERDIRSLAEVSDQQSFARFVSLCAALTAQEINFSQLGRDIGITPQTANRWLSILKATYQWFELQAYHGNTIKRISGKPKGYFSDTGLACNLQRISSPDALSAHPLLGSLFETLVVLEIMRHFSHMNTPPQCYHWRTHSGAEVDMLLERDGIFWPIEIKAKANVSRGDARGITAFRETYPQLRVGPGIIIAAVERSYWLTDDVLTVPYDLV